MAFSLRCPDCRGKFPWTAKDRWPRFCPLCSADINNDRDDADVVMPAFLSPRTKANDAVMRGIADGSETRMHHAAELAGVPVSEMRDMKVTNLNDRRDAEVMAMPVNNDVSKFMQANPGVAGFQGGAGIGYSGAVQTGPAPNAGARMMTALNAHHANPRTGGVVADAPALETKSPLYRRRG